MPEKLLSKLHGLEDEKCASLDILSDVFGELLSYYFRCGAPEDKADAASVIGNMTGKYVYAADACDDYEKDEKNGSYNPLLCGEGTKENKMQSAYGAMCIWADRAAGELTLEGAEGHSFYVADNILRLGMVDTAKKLTSGRISKKHGKRPL